MHGFYEKIWIKIVFFIFYLNDSLKLSTFFSKQFYFRNFLVKKRGQMSKDNYTEHSFTFTVTQKLIFIIIQLKIMFW